MDNTEESKEDEGYYSLLAAEINHLVPNFSTALRGFSLPGIDFESIEKSINQYESLVSRVKSAADIADQKGIEKICNQIIDNLECIKQYGTAITIEQESVFKQWLTLLIKYLENPTDISKAKLINCVKNPSWLIIMNKSQISHLYHDLISFPKDHALTNGDENHTTVPEPQNTLKNNSQNFTVSIVNNRHDSAKRENTKETVHPIIINRKNAWVRAIVHDINLLFPQTDISSIETISGVITNAHQSIEVGSLEFKKNLIPVYYIADDFELKSFIPESCKYALILKSNKGHYGLLCDVFKSYTLREPVEIKSIPFCIKSANSPVHAISHLEKEVHYVVRSNDLRSYIGIYHDME